MEVLTAGHLYRVHNIDGDGTQTIQFVQRRDIAGELLPERQRTPGILSQELLRVLIDRTLYLYAEDPCAEDTEIVQHLRAALVRYETRAARRTIEKLAQVEKAPPCPACGHVLCKHEVA